MTPVEAAVLRSVSALSVLGAPPTLSEVCQHIDVAGTNVIPTLNEIEQALGECVEAGKLVSRRGRYLPPSLRESIEPILTGEEWMPRKLRKAKRIARWLVRLGGVRAVSLCNRTAFGLPRDEGDLDFFVIVHHGSIWQTRALAGLPFVLLGDRPKSGVSERDVVCLSFFLSDQMLDLTFCALGPDDVYLRHWFLGLLPLVDDGVGEELWKANAVLLQRHPLAECWIPSPDLKIVIPKLQIPVTKILEYAARVLQWKYFPRALREKANKDTHVMISDVRLKFHVDDGREAIQEDYKKLCGSYGIAP